MSSLNRTEAQKTVLNHNGLAVKKNNDPNEQLIRVTLAHMLWEDNFYVNGANSANAVVDAVKKADPAFVARLAYLARTQFKLRHVPLLLMRELARSKKLKAEDLAAVIQRADEMPEFLSMYWKEKKVPIANQVKKGLALAFAKFNEYALAKNDKNKAAITMRDVMFLTHPKPTSAQQTELFRKVAANELSTPDTWETALSAGADKKETFTRLMAEKQLGALAFLRNLRNMTQAGVNEDTIRAYAKDLDVSKVLPFRYIAAAAHVPHLEDMLEEMLFRSTATLEKIPGKTVLLVDVSGSMFGTKISAKSDLERFHAAAALAMLCREVCESVEIYSFSNRVVRVPPRRGFELVKAISESQSHQGTATGDALRSINANTSYDRCIVFTDEQSSDRIPNPKGKGYVINVAAYTNGITTGTPWVSLSGFSEAVLDYLRIMEQHDL